MKETTESLPSQVSFFRTNLNLTKIEKIQTMIWKLIIYLVELALILSAVWTRKTHYMSQEGLSFECYLCNI
jgi:hypothetical protein